jgi:hypothetical protein
MEIAAPILAILTAIIFDETTIILGSLERLRP